MPAGAASAASGANPSEPLTTADAAPAARTSPRCASVDQGDTNLSGEVLLARGVVALEMGMSKDALYYLCAVRATHPGPAIEAAIQILEVQIQRSQGGQP